MENESNQQNDDREAFDVVCNRCQHRFHISFPFGYILSRPVLCRCERCKHPIINPNIDISMVDNN